MNAFLKDVNSNILPKKVIKSLLKGIVEREFLVFPEEPVKCLLGILKENFTLIHEICLLLINYNFL